ncbi:NADP-dependent oxidoreductase [Liquorilactobacillus mali]|uniref:NADPH quinone reductase related Zn-dependent oxidoreductase n=1 Tax=Liquorilactobacillus mali KCTC 3596 = DSM 20444 TaxID=1046596 RepID=A0A0R2E794_9LACO|nr:NADP-dependent oxidoreductase [Liquorilactobacillus mali]KRN11195.1 NADPH quinone reductase related Zn-dependent oxidoreductase [Liquorilactobacillus mali KCTC 3596 = DSM 20444]QFQ73809.1 NADP-dependent oxidoreductase [Liquorilactobacillus mali]
MKAIAIREYGDIDNLKEIELKIPELAEDEVLVENYATSINPIDWKARLGYLKGMYPWKFPVVLGWDTAGIITQVGAKVADFKVGDKIFARPDIYIDGKKGTYAQYVAVKEDKLALKPDEITFEAAAAVPLAGLTALQVIVDRLKVKKGDKVLIQGGAGGVGLFAIQIAKHLGAYVATTASKKNHEFLKSLGADEVIDYHETKIDAVLNNYDAVFDTVNAIDDGLAILKENGRLVTIAGNPSEEQKASSKEVSSWWLQPNGKQLGKLGNLIVAGEVKVIIDSVYSLTAEGVRAAHKKSQEGHARGKIVIKVK